MERRVVVGTMTRHKCNADDCPRAVQKGPKMKCCKCGTLCYLQCYGFEAGSKIDGLDTVKLTSEGIVFTAFLSTMAFSCCTQTLSPAEQKAALKMPSATRSTSKSRATTSNENEQLIANELTSIKEMLTSLKNATEANTVEIAAIKSLSTETEAHVKKVTENPSMPQTMNQDTPLAPAMDYVRRHRFLSYAKAAAATPNNAKRKKIATPIHEKLHIPAAKVGKKANANGLQVVPKVNRSDVEPKFTKALYVSRLNPATTNEQLTEYITENTPINDSTKFNVHKMIKKGVDESTLKFVSFKVELNVDELNVLDDASMWPEGIQVREFQQAPKNELGRHFPSLNAKDKNAATKPDEQMETAAAQA